MSWKVLLLITIIIIIITIIITTISVLVLFLLLLLPPVLCHAASHQQHAQLHEQSRCVSATTVAQVWPCLDLIHQSALLYLQHAQLHEWRFVGQVPATSGLCMTG